MNKALILHGTDFKQEKRQKLANWFPWLKKELEKGGYKVWLPELPQAWKPDLERYWQFLKDFEYDEKTIIVGHSSGGAMVFGLLHKLPVQMKVGLAISVAGFYKDEGWGCEGLFREKYDWGKIRNQANKIEVVWSPDDPYISYEQTSYLVKKCGVEPIIIPGQKHFNLEAGEKFRKFPELLGLIKSERV